MAKNLTNRQREIFNYIQKCIKEGYPANDPRDWQSIRVL